MRSTVSVAELAARLERQAPANIVDVRSPAEFAAGHIPGACNVAWTEIGGRTADLPGGPDDEIVVYCGHGPRAWIAAGVLRRKGYRRVTLLDGHWSAWHRAGLRIET